MKIVVDKNREFRDYFGRIFCARGDEVRVLDSIDACVTACGEFSPEWILISISEQTNGIRKIGKIISELPAARIGIIDIRCGASAGMGVLLQIGKRRKEGHDQDEFGGVKYLYQFISTMISILLKG